MNQKTRHYLFLFFVLIFIISTPLISLYASGYKLGNGFSLQKTGILILDSRPNDAKIYINNKIQQNFINKLLKQDEGFATTPEKIKNLLPGEYIIKIEKENYWPWEKKLSVKPGESTFAEDIILFKKNTPAIIKEGNFFDAQIKLFDNFLTIINNNNLSFQYNNGETRDFVLAEKTKEEVMISPENNKIIIGKYIYDLKNLNNEEISLNKIVGASSENIKWGNNDNELYYLNGSLINHFDIAANKFTILFRDHAYSDYMVKNNYIYFISKADSTSELSVYDQTKKEVIRKISLPFSDYIFTNQENKILNVLDKNHDILYLIDPLSRFKPLQETINNVKQSLWLKDNILIFATSFEIWSFDLSLSKKTLLTRLGSEIKNISTHPKKNYIFFSTDTSINTLELDDREKYNITKLIESEKISNLLINKKGDTLFFYSKNNEQEGIFKLEI